MNLLERMKIQFKENNRTLMMRNKQNKFKNKNHQKVQMEVLMNFSIPREKCYVRK